MSKPLQIAALEASGGLVSETPVEKEIDWYEVNDDGQRVPTKFTVHVLRLSFSKVEEAVKDPNSRTVRLISAGILFDGGETRLTQEQDSRLDPDLAKQLIEAFNGVNGMKGDMGKSSSASQTSSGMK